MQNETENLTQKLVAFESLSQDEKKQLIFTDLDWSKPSKERAAQL